MPRSAAQILELLRSEGASRLRRVALRENRSTIWSLTQDGRVLNLHVAFARAPLRILRAFAVIARDGRLRRPTPDYLEARGRIARWPELHQELRKIRARSSRLRAPAGPGPGVGPCCATPAQRAYLRRLYRYLNATRFGGRLPQALPLRLSSRMTRRLGQMVPGVVDGRPAVLELALSVDLMLEGNGRERLDTLLHEMAHAAAWLFDGDSGHGEAWRRWARRVGCDDRAMCHAPIRRRRRTSDRITRVPPLPPGWREEAA